MAERLGAGLQTLPARFDSASVLQDAPLRRSHATACAKLFTATAVAERGVPGLVAQSGEQPPRKRQTRVRLPPSPPEHGSVAQLGARPAGCGEVAGSTPAGSTIARAAGWQAWPSEGRCRWFESTREHHSTTGSSGRPRLTGTTFQEREHAAESTRWEARADRTRATQQRDAGGTPAPSTINAAVVERPPSKREHTQVGVLPAAPHGTGSSRRRAPRRREMRLASTARSTTHGPVVQRLGQRALDARMEVRILPGSPSSLA